MSAKRNRLPTEIDHPFQSSRLSHHSRPMYEWKSVVSYRIRDCIIDVPAFLQVRFNGGLKLFKISVRFLILPIRAIYQGQKKIMVLWACLFSVTEGCTCFPRHLARKKSTFSRKLRIETNPSDRVSTTRLNSGTFEQSRYFQPSFAW